MPSSSAFVWIRPWGDGLSEKFPLSSRNRATPENRRSIS
jgi:hypothetical protein